MATLPNALTTDAGPYRVLVVDDSAVIRGMLRRWLEEDSTIKVVASAPDGQAALREAQAHRPEVVFLDIEMPVLDGMATLPKLKALLPDTHVVMASTLTKRNASVSLQAMRLGASDYLAKPESRLDTSAQDQFKTALIGKTRALAGEMRRKRRKAQPAALKQSAVTGLHREAKSGLRPVIERPACPTAVIETPAARPSVPSRAKQAVSTPRPYVSISAAPTPQNPRRGPFTTPRVLAIGSSTGGPQALFKVFEGLRETFDLPILITQHMPSTFTSILAGHIDKIAKGRCAEAEHNEPVVSGRIYIAPGGQHMCVRGTMTAPVIELNEDPPENFCRPAADPMFRSIAEIYGPAALGVVLTGMGSDGAKGAGALRARGARTFVQDESTSTVWGMPGAVTKAGFADETHPIERMAEAIMRTVRT